MGEEWSLGGLLHGIWAFGGHLSKDEKGSAFASGI